MYVRDPNYTDIIMVMTRLRELESFTRNGAHDASAQWAIWTIKGAEDSALAPLL